MNGPDADGGYGIKWVLIGLVCLVIIAATIIAERS